MKFLRTLSSLLVVLGLLTVSSCQHDIDTYLSDNNNIGQILTPSPVQASVNGVVLDQNEQAVVGATVTSGTQTTTTDNRGLFRFEHIQMDKYASFVTVEYSGFFKGIRTFSATEGSSNFVKIKLIPKTLIGTVDASAGGAVTLPNNSIVTLQANSVVVKSTGQAYTGNINVYAANIDPTLADIAQTIPGSFQALDANNFRVLLKSYGMLAVQLEGQSGELLQIATNKTAKLRFTIPSSLASAAPSTIPLWSLDETNGLWKEEGEATKSGNYYEGDVAHFSFWNCDGPSNAIFLELTVETADGPLPNGMVKITRLNNPTSTYGYTDSAGHVGGLVFYNEPLLLEILGNCHEVVYSQNIGPFTQNTNLGTLTVTLTVAGSMEVSGNAVDCSSQPVTSGVAYIYWEDQLISTPISNGIFSVTLTRCNSSTEPIEIVAYDIASHQQSSPWVGTANSSGVVNAGTISACGVSTYQWMDYSINGGPMYSYAVPGDSLSMYPNGGTTNTIFTGFSNVSSAGYLSFAVTNPMAVGNGQTFASLACTNIENGQSPLTIALSTPLTITEYGNIGEYIAGNGVVTVTSQSGNTYSVFINFRILRAY